MAHRVQKGDMGLGTQGVKTAYEAISPPPKKTTKKLADNLKPWRISLHVILEIEYGGWTLIGHAAIENS